MYPKMEEKSFGKWSKLLLTVWVFTLHDETI